MAVKKTTAKAKKKAPVRVSKKKRGISKFQAIAVVGVLALIGVVAVVASRASGTPNYQYSYSAYCVAKSGDTAATTTDDCKSKSAEAMVYRLYKGMFNRAPQPGELQYWTQQLAGDRTKVTELAIVQKQVPKMGTDTAYVTTLYTQMMGRTAKSSEVSSWVKRISSKKWSREKVAYHFATTSEAVRKNQAAFTTYLATAPKVTVKQTAAEDQKVRFEKIKSDYVVPAQKDLAATNAAVAKARAQVMAAKATASKKNPSLNDLKAIGANDAAAKSAQKTARGAARDASEKAKAAGKMHARAKALASYATDIADNSTYGITKIKARYVQADDAADAASEKSQSVQGMIVDIAQQYGVAEQKYEAEVNRKAAAAAAAAQASSGGSGGGGAGGAGGAGGSGGTGVAGTTETNEGNIGLIPGIGGVTTGSGSVDCSKQSYSYKTINGRFWNKYTNVTKKKSFWSGKCIVGSKRTSPKAIYPIKGILGF